MRLVVAQLRDRRGRQRGSVLSGVLIITAFIAIITAALLTALSTNLLLARNLGTRAANQATMNSAMELALNQLQTTAIGNGCPTLASVTLNSRTAVPAYTSCWPAYREGTYSPGVSTTSSFGEDGTHSIVTRAGRDVYDVGSAAGTVYHFAFGQTTPQWSRDFRGSVSAPPATFPDVSGSTNRMITAVPLTIPLTQRPLECILFSGCTAMLSESGGLAPDGLCYLPTPSVVGTRIAISANTQTVFFAGDQGGNLTAFTVNGSGLCTPVDSVTGTGSPIVAGPFVIPGPVNGSTRVDDVYVVTSGTVRRYTFTHKNTSDNLALASSFNLVASSAVGADIEGTTLPAHMAITFSSGRVQEVQIRTDFTVQSLGSTTVPSTLRAAPFWCNCPGADRIAVAGGDGAFYLLDTSLARVGTLPAGTTTIATAPTSDVLGDWFFGGGDGYVHEIQLPAGQTQMVEVARFGPLGAAVGSSPRVGSCTAGLCVYTADTAGEAFMIPLDSRQVVISTCISSAPPACSGVKPRLWAKVQVGTLSSQKTIHVQGWSYYSP